MEKTYLHVEFLSAGEVAKKSSNIGRTNEIVRDWVFGEQHIFEDPDNIMRVDNVERNGVVNTPFRRIEVRGVILPTGLNQQVITREV